MRLKLSRLTRISLLLAVFFGLDKGLGILRQVIIARQFGLSSALDVYNVANNVPDLLYALISGGALAMALIPILADLLTNQGRQLSWKVFSQVANLSFLVAGGMALLVAILAGPMVKAQIGVAPGFTADQQDLVVELMRLNLIAMMIFSLSGLVMAGLQANQHFLLPALAPLLYNTGQIIGATVFAPVKGISIGSVTLPALGLGIHGLIYGVILGASFHLLIQVPGLLMYQFHWTPTINLRDPDVLRVLRMIGPRILTVLFVQLIFIIRDNLASRLATGSVSALTYGWMIQQVPETLIGTAIGTALLPTLAEQFAGKDIDGLKQTIGRAVRVLIALTLPIAAILSLGLRPLLAAAFGFDAASVDVLLWTTRGFLLGLVGHSLLEIASRSFYAQQDALFPLLGSVVNVILYIVLGSVLYRQFGAPGISLTDSLAYSTQAIFLFVLLAKKKSISFPVGSTLWRSLAAAGLGAVVAVFITRIGGQFQAILIGPSAMAIAMLFAMPLVWPEIRTLVRL
jgi:putative peptidoglycan lipid II flippase